MRYLVQAIFALAVLVGLPVFLETPTSTAGIVAATVGAVILIGVGIQGMIGYVHSRKPKSFPDSIMAPPKPGERKPPTPRPGA